MTRPLNTTAEVLYCTALYCTVLYCTDHASAEEMHAGCSPALFYHAHRPLLSGWRDNPALPEGLVYEVTTLPRNLVYLHWLHQGDLVGVLNKQPLLCSLPL